MEQEQGKGFFERHVTHIMVAVLAMGTLYVSTINVPVNPIVRFVGVLVFGGIMYLILHPSPGIPDGPIQLITGLIASAATAWLIYDKVPHDFITVLLAALVFAVVFTGLSKVLEGISHFHA